MALNCQSKLRQLIRGTNLSQSAALMLLILSMSLQTDCSQQTATNLPSQQHQSYQGLTAKSFNQLNGFQLFSAPNDLSYNNVDHEEQQSANAMGASLPKANGSSAGGPANQTNATGGGGAVQETLGCPNGLLTFELSTGFIFKPTSGHETLSMMPSTLQLTDCLDYCLNNQSCLAINFEMGLCVLLATSAKQNPQNLYSSQFPVFTIYAEKKCLLASDGLQAKQRQRRCQRAWTFERVAGYEMKTKPRRRIKVSSKEACMDACLIERDFECRSANWYRLRGECTLSDQDRHSVSQSEAGDQQIKSSLSNFYGPSNSSTTSEAAPFSSNLYGKYNNNLQYQLMSAATGPSLLDESRLNNQLASSPMSSSSSSSYLKPETSHDKFNHLLRPIENSRRRHRQLLASQLNAEHQMAGEHEWQHYVDMPSNAIVDYLENNCVYEPNKLCEFRKIQNRILKTVDSIYQDVATLDECKQKCLNAPYRCYSFDYGDTSERVCRTSHLDQASLLSVKEPYLEVMGAITYELAACFNVSISCRAKEMVAFVSSSKAFRGKIYAKTRPGSCVNDVKEALQFELPMRYHDDACDVRAASNQQKGVFSSDIVIQHHDRIMTTQDVGLSVYCQYDLGNRSVTNNVDLAIDRIPDGPAESKQQASSSGGVSASSPANGQPSSPLTITGLATTVVKSPNVTMRITNMNGQPVSSATVGDRLALLFEVQEKSSPFGIFVREIVAMDGKQLLTTIQQQQVIANNSTNKNDNQLKLGSNGRNYFNSLAGGYHNASGGQPQADLLNETRLQSALVGMAATPANSIQFIDSDGCPTDANLMGPLVKMDPSGHRLLAPFDAFKFPTSDMVFFRAVVTSCLAECKPAVCSPGGQAAAAGASDVLPEAVRQHNPATGTTDSSYLLTSRAGSTGGTSTTTASPTSTPRTTSPAVDSLSTSATTTTLISTMGASNLSELMAAELNQNGQAIGESSFARSTVGESAPTTSSGGMTIVVPGFSTSPRAASDGEPGTPTAGTTPAISSWPTTSAPAGFTAGQLLADLLHQVNMTNNHNGKVRPTASAGLAPSASSFNSNTNDVDPVGQMTSLLEMASMSAEQKQQILSSFEAKLRQKFSSKPSQAPLIINGTSAPELADLTDLYTGLLNSLMSSSSASSGNTNEKMQTSHEDASDHRTNRTIGEQLSDAFVSLLNSKSNQRQQVDSGAKVDYDKTSANSLETTNEQFRLMETRTSNNRTTTTAPTQQQQEMKSQQAGNRTQKKRDKTNANLQALADSYLGAFQSFGKRRRRKREASLGDDSTSHYVYMEQPQFGATQLASVSGLPEGARFTQAIVEMYHTNGQADGHNLEHVKSARRVRRQASSAFDQVAPVGQTEELVVQSIKIVDRLQFKDERQAGAKESQQRAARSDLVMAGQVKKPPGWANKASSTSSLGRPPQVTKDQVDNDLHDNQLMLNQIRASSSLSAFTVFLVALCFVFVQISMVVICLVDWSTWKGSRSSSSSLSSRSSETTGSINIDCSNPFDDSTILSSYRSDSSPTIMTPTTSTTDDGYDNRRHAQPNSGLSAVGQTYYHQYKPSIIGRGRRDERYLGSLLRHHMGSGYLMTYNG